MFIPIKMLVLVVSYSSICMEAGRKESTTHLSVLAMKEPIQCLNAFTVIADWITFETVRHMSVNHFSICKKCGTK